jgi:hypothetical protein
MRPTKLKPTKSQWSEALLVAYIAQRSGAAYSCK